ncbi:MAG: hypothetical protein H0X46_03510, partial [Bacteroidetes bacterium]|nr:hypothetical protein [Bacteroidota bacterium]
IGSSRTLDMATYALSGTLSSISGTGTLQTQNTSGTPIPVAKTWVSIVEYNSASAQTIVYGSYVNLNATNGDRTLSASDTVHISGSYTTGAGAYTVAGSSVDFNGSTQNIPAFTFYNLKAGGSGNKTATGALVVNGGLTVASGRMLNMATYALSGTISSNAGGGILQTSNNSSTPIPSGLTWNIEVQYALDGAQSIVSGTYSNLLSGGGISIPTKAATGNITVNGLLTIGSNGTFNLSTYLLSGSLTTSGIVATLTTQNTTSTPIPAGKTWAFSVKYNSASSQTIVNGNYAALDATGGDRVLSPAGNIGVAGTFAPGAGTFIVTGSTLDFNGTSTQTIPVFTYDNLIISGAHTSNNVTLPSGIIAVNGNLTFNQTFAGGAFSTAGNTILLGSGSNQYINGSASGTLGKLTVNKSAGKVLLTTPVTVEKQLILTEGIVGASATNFITLTSTADTILGGSDSSYVSGPLKKIGNIAFTFALGDTLLASGAYHPLGITAPSTATDAYTGQYYSTNQTYGDSLQVDSLQYISDCEYWNLTRNAGSSTVVPTLSWNSNSCNIDNYEDLRVAAWDGSEWKSMGSDGGTFDGARGTLIGLTGLSLTAAPLIIAKKPAKPVPYFILKRTLDAGCFLVQKGKLNFKFDEEYNDTDGLLAFTIYNDKVHTVKTTNQLIPSPKASSFGEKWFSLNLWDCGISPTGIIGNGYYILEVKNEKQEKWYLRFKHQYTGLVLCSSATVGTFRP